MDSLSKEAGDGSRWEKLKPFRDKAWSTEDITEQLNFYEDCMKVAYARFQVCCICQLFILAKRNKEGDGHFHGGKE